MENGILTQTTEYTPYKGHCRKFFLCDPVEGDFRGL